MGVLALSTPDLALLAASFRGLGLAVLAEKHRLTVTALVGGVVSDVRERQVGFRDVQRKEETIHLNGRPIFFRNAWRLTRHRY